VPEWLVEAGSDGTLGRHECPTLKGLNRVPFFVVEASEAQVAQQTASAARLLRNADQSTSFEWDFVLSRAPSMSSIQGHQVVRANETLEYAALARAAFST